MAFKNERVGVATISLTDVFALADFSSPGFWTINNMQCRIYKTESESAVLGSIRVSLMRHRSLSDPRPVAIAVRVVEGCGNPWTETLSAPSVPSVTTNLTSSQTEFAVRVQILRDEESRCIENSSAACLMTDWISATSPELPPTWPLDSVLLIRGLDCSESEAAESRRRSKSGCDTLLDSLDEELAACIEESSPADIASLLASDPIYSSSAQRPTSRESSRRASVMPARVFQLQDHLQSLLSRGGIPASRHADVPLAHFDAPADTSMCITCDLSVYRYLRLTVLQRRRSTSISEVSAPERVCGELRIPIDSLWGDDSSVVYHRELVLDRWFRVLPTVDADEGADFGHLRLHLTFRYNVELLPRGWLEAVDSDSGASYFYNVEKGVSQWQEPAVIALSRPAVASARPRTKSDDVVGMHRWALAALQAAPQQIAKNTEPKSGTAAARNRSRSSTGSVSLAGVSDGLIKSEQTGEVVDEEDSARRQRIEQAISGGRGADNTLIVAKSRPPPPPPIIRLPPAAPTRTPRAPPPPPPCSEMTTPDANDPLLTAVVAVAVEHCDDAVDFQVLPQVTAFDDGSRTIEEESEEGEGECASDLDVLAPLADLLPASKRTAAIPTFENPLSISASNSAGLSAGKGLV
jgi:hypothetical protein